MSVSAFRAERAPTEELEHLELAHYHPGRLRLRALAFHYEDTVARVRAALEAEPGVEHVVHNAKTGGLLIEYQPGLGDADQIIARVAAAAGLALPLDEEELKARRARPAVVAIGVTRELNAVVDELSGGRVDLRALVPAGLAALAVYSFRKDATLPRWDNLVWWSYSVFAQLHRSEIDGSAEQKSGFAPQPPRGSSAGQVEGAPSVGRGRGDR